MWKRNHQFLKEKEGVISIEFAVIFPFILLLFMFALEMGRLMLIGSSLDLMTAEVSRKTAITENINKNSTSYTDIFNELIAQDMPLWPALTSKDKFTVDVQFCQSIKDVIDNRCNSTVSDQDKIILFELNYQYLPMFSTFFKEAVDASLSKKVVIYREFHS